MGKKRASPGVDIEKNPLGDVGLSDAHNDGLDEICEEARRVDIQIEFLSIEKTDPFLRKRREVLKSIPKFWPTALSNHPIFQIHVAHNQDQDALNYLEDVWLARDPEEKRCFTLEFYFRENPYFSDPVLKKEYRYIPPADIDDEKDEWNVTNTQAAFAWSVNVVPQATKIHWRDDSRNLTKAFPPVVDHDNKPSEPGSFFNFFEIAEDPNELGLAIAHEVFPDPIDYFRGPPAMDSSEDEDDEEDDDDENEEEIDLEKPRPKKQRI